MSEQRPIADVKGDRPGKRATLADVAARAGVSKTTASRVLNHRSTAIPVRQSTIGRIRVAAKELGYQPNPFAKALVHGRSQLVGVVIRDISDPFSGAVIDAFSKIIKTHGYRLVLSHTGSDSLEENHFPRLFNDRIADGVLVVGDSPRDGRLAMHLAETVEYIVGFARGDSQPRFVSVNVDNVHGTNLALDYLCELGHQRIAHIACTESSDLRLRLEAYGQFMEREDIPKSEDYVWSGPNARRFGYQAMLSLLDLAHRPTAVYAATDILAVGALHAAAERGVRVPADLSVVGFDDLAFSSFTCPPLTTVHHPIEEMAQKAASLLLDMIEGKGPPQAPMNYIMEPTLIVRGSCARAPC